MILANFVFADVVNIMPLCTSSC